MTGDYSAVKKLAIATVAAGGAGVGLASLDLPPWLITELQKYGPVSLLIFGLALGIKYFVPQDAVVRFLQSQQDLAVSTARVADQLQVLTGQAGKLDQIIEMIEEVKFNSDIFGDRLVRIEEHMINVKRQDGI